MMPTKFLYPCPHCGHAIELVAVQAGQEFECSTCHQQLEAPKLGEMKKLPRVGGEEKSSNARASGIKRTLFASGLALALLMGGTGTALYRYASTLIVDLDWEHQFSYWNEQIDQLPPATLLDEWNNLNVEAGLGEWQEQPFARYRTQGLILQKIALGLWGLAIVGIVMMFGSFFTKGK